MNFIFISPNFPKTYWNFCDRLKKNGVNVLGIGDNKIDILEDEVIDSLTEYFYVPDMEVYENMKKAVEYYIEKYGKIDWIESNNEYWLELDAGLRTDFNIYTGIRNDEIESVKSKAAMKIKYKEGGIPTARGCKVVDFNNIMDFIDEVGYPVIAKPEIGVGAAYTYKIENENDLLEFFETKPDVAYVCEEFITGDICSYDAIIDSKGEPVFENMTLFPPSIADIVNENLDFAYYTCKEVPEKFSEIGRKTVKAFGVKNRFVHLEFFRLTKEKKNLGRIGDYVALEVNMRPAGGYSPDFMSFGHNVDVYQIWADMVMGKNTVTESDGKKYFCVYAGRKDGKSYVHSHSEILDKYGSVMKMCERMPEIMVDVMGNQMYVVILEEESEVKAFIEYVHSQEN